jgi:hypothetical protein
VGRATNSTDTSLVTSSHSPTTGRLKSPLTTHSNGLAKRRSASGTLTRPILEREPCCFQATPAALPDYLSERLAVLVYDGPRLVLKFAQPSDDCFHERLVFNGRGASEVAALAGMFVGSLPGSDRSELVTLPSASRKLINTERSSSTDGARASSPVRQEKNARRTIPLTPRAAALIEMRRTIGNGGWVFPAPTRSGHIEKSTPKRQHPKAYQFAKVAAFSLYTFRHTCLTRWEEYMDPFTLAIFSGAQRFFNDAPPLCWPPDGNGRGCDGTCAKWSG